MTENLRKPNDFMTAEWQLRLFERGDDLFVIDRKLPHWYQPETMCFVTWRTADSMPAVVLRRWQADREEWLRRHGIDPQRSDWRQQLRIHLAPEEQGRFYQMFSERWHEELDSGHGACLLRRPKLAKIVADSLHYGDGDRYFLTDFVVMPNHVHVLAAFRGENAMLRQCQSWKHYTAVQINRELGKRGSFWQQDGFDHLVRSTEQFEAIRRYIRENPVKARLREGEFIHYSKEMSPRSSVNS